MRLLIGGSPCTYWSVAQKKDRETEASGQGWELFKNYLLALEKFKPDYFLYENNKSMSPAIRAQITREFGIEPVMINSALVSAQNRERLYWCGRRNADGTYSRVNVPLPEDKGIILRDILESGICWREKGYALLASSSTGKTAEDMIARRQSNGVAEPVCVAQRGRYTREDGGVEQHFEVQTSGKTNTLTTVQKDNLIAEPIRIGTIESKAKNAEHDSQQYRVYSPEGKSVTLCGNGGGVGAKTGLYAAPIRVGDMPNADGDVKYGQAKRIYDANGKAVTLNARPRGGVVGPLYEIPVDGGEKFPVYEVKDGLIEIKGKWFPIRLPDGFYIIRKLTVKESMRLQTVPEEFVFPVSDSQAYKMLGNGWTVDVIAHILSYCRGLFYSQVDVLSMYDGMACGHIALDKLGVKIRSYHATEIDKYAVQTATHNFPDIVELGDAFQVRADDWALEIEEPEKVVVLARTKLEELPTSCEVCRMGRRYGLVGDVFCKITEEYFTGNVKPPFKERPDECPLFAVPVGVPDTNADWTEYEQLKIAGA